MKSLHNWTHSTAFNLLSLFFLVFSAPSGALEFSSGENQTQLIELFTSEGCSSCPPADRWLSSLKNDAGLWRDFVPVAYHVDYWDYIGWKDIFAKPDHGARQRKHAQLGNIKTVYTPGFVVDGTEWRGWFSGQNLPSRKQKAGILSANYADNHLHVHYRASAPLKQLSVTVVLLAADISSQVKRGENANRTLKHDFAVLSEKTVALSDTEDGFSASFLLPMPLAAEAIAAWVTAGDELEPLQATGTWLDNAASQAPKFD